MTDEYVGGTGKVGRRNPVTTEEAERARRLSRLGFALSCVWFLFLIFPVVWLYGVRDDPARLFPAAAAMVLFVSVYVWAVWHAVRGIAGVTEPLGRTARWTALSILTAISLVMPLAYGANWIGPLGFVSFLAGLTLSFRSVAVVAVALVSAVTAAVISPVWGAAVSITINSALAAPGAFLVRRLVVTNRELRAARREIAHLAISEERLRLSREIHDTLTQGFTSITMHLSPVRNAMDSGALGRTFGWRKADRHLELIDRTARESLEEARRLVWALRPRSLHDTPLPEAIERLAASFTEESGVSANVSSSGEATPLSPEIEVTLLRAAQEALSNVRKHAGAKRVALTLSYLEDAIALDVRDDGAGFDPEADVRTDALGLAGMRERVEGAGGTLSVESSPGNGATLAVELPLTIDRRPGTERTNAGEPR